MSATAMSVKTGGWSEWTTEMSKKTLEVFEKAVKILGVKYTPLAVSTQVVAGMNYRFFCNAKGVYPGAPDSAAMIEIFAPVQGDPHIIEIKPC